MGHDPGEGGAAVLQHAADRDETAGIAGLNARAVAIAVDLDQHRKPVAGGARRGGDGLRAVEVVEEDRQIGAAAAQIEHMIELVGRDADGVQDVLEAVADEILGFLEGRYRDRPRAALGHDAGHLDALGRLEVRAQMHAEARQTAAQTHDIGLHAVSVEQEAGCLQAVEPRRR